MSDGFESRMSDFTKAFAVDGTRREPGTGALVGARTEIRGVIVRLYVGSLAGLWVRSSHSHLAVMAFSRWWILDKPRVGGGDTTLTLAR